MAGSPGAGDAIDYRVATPVWRQLAAILRRRILAGEIQPGHVIPSELQLKQEFGLAHGTIRKAVALLRDEELVVTVVGRGTYVVDPLPPPSDGPV
jgi:GntR family transcriptional regulator